MRRPSDLFVISFLVMLGFLYAVIFRHTYAGSALFVGVALGLPPTIYMGLRKAKNWKKILVSVFVFGFLFGFFLEFINEFTYSYKVISAIPQLKVFGVLPLDNVIGHIIMTLFTITFYQHFVKKDLGNIISPYVYVMAVFTLLNIAAVSIVSYTKPELLYVPYPYFILGCLAVTPMVVLAFSRPRLIRNMVIIVPYFFTLYFFSEILAVKLNYWVYPGDYVGWVSFFGVRFPFEELFFWMLLYAPALVSYYEMFVEDDAKN